MDSRELNTTFNVGDIVMYPAQGVGSIEKTETRNGRDYLRIKLFSSSMDVLLPAVKAGELGLRHLTPKDEISKVLDSLSIQPDNQTSDWKTRLQENQLLIKSGQLSSIANVVNSLYRRSKSKELPSMERKVYEDALSMLVVESSSVLGISDEETKRLIFSKLEA